MPSLPRDQLSLPFSDDEADEPGETGTCRKCGLTWPIADFYVKDRKTGRRSTTCRSCQYTANRANFLSRREREPEKVLAQQCAGVKRWREANPEKVKENNRKYVEENIEAVREAERAYRAVNPEKTRAKKKRYAAKHKAVIRAADARYREAHYEELKARQKAWRDAHPERIREIEDGVKHRRRARLAGSGGDHTAAEWEAVKKLFDYRCYLCGRQEPEIKLTRDHFIPISKGGNNYIGNIIPACKPCNSRKHARMPVRPYPLPPPGDDVVQSGIPEDSPSPEA
jgi:5-methylcytosine-specific restriction endonuclease McrA